MNENVLATPTAKPIKAKQVTKKRLLKKGHLNLLNNQNQNQRNKLKLNHQEKP